MGIITKDQDFIIKEFKMATIEFYKASKKDKKATVRVSQLREHFTFPKLNPGDIVHLTVGDNQILTFKASRFNSEIKDCATIYGTVVWPKHLPQIDTGMKTNLEVKNVITFFGKNKPKEETKKETVVNYARGCGKTIDKVLNKKLLMIQVETGEGPEVTEVTRKQINDMFPGDLEMNEPVTIKLIEMTQAKSDECCVRGEIVCGEMYPKRMVISRFKEDIKKLEEQRKAIDEEILALNIRIENVRKMKV